jgi:hypothetical protein
MKTNQYEAELSHTHTQLRDSWNQNHSSSITSVNIILRFEKQTQVQSERKNKSFCIEWTSLFAVDKHKVRIRVKN